MTHLNDDKNTRYPSLIFVSLHWSPGPVRDYQYDALAPTLSRMHPI